MLTPSESPPNPFDRGYYFSADLQSMGFKTVGHDVQIAKTCTIVGVANVSIGNHVRIDDYVVIGAAGGSISFGNNIHVGAACYFGARGGVVLGDFSNLSQGVRIYSASDDYSGTYLTNPTVPAKYLGVDVAAVHIGRHVIIGSGSVVLPGCALGEGAAVGALSLVTKKLDDWTVYGGIPARRLKSRSRKGLALEAQLKQERGE